MNTMNEANCLFSDQKIYIQAELKSNHLIDHKNINSCKKAIYVVEWAEGLELDAQYQELISKMNAAVKYLPEDLQIICFDKQTRWSVLELKEHYQCELIAIFGNLLNASIKQMSLPLNKLVSIHGVKVIQTNSIQEIFEDAALKNKYWIALRSILS